MIQFLLCITVLPVIQGLTFIRLKKEKETVTLTQCYIMGLLFLFLLGETVSCAAVKMECSFTLYCKILGIAVIVTSLLSLLLNRRQALALFQNVKKSFGQKQRSGIRLPRHWAEIALLAALCLMQLACYFLYVPDTGSDTMTETISVTVLTDTIFQYNPVTGQILRYGMYPIYKFASLPLLYSALYYLCGVSMDVFLYYAIPLWVLLMNFAVLWEWGRIFFGEQREKRRLFFLFMALLTVMGDGESSSYAYTLLHGGWKGTAMAAAVVVPFGVFIVYSMLTEKEWLYGCAGIALSVCGLLFTRPLFVPENFAFTAGDTGRQWGMLLLSVLVLYLVRERTGKQWRRRELLFLAACLLLGLVSGDALVFIGTAYAGTCIWGVAEEWKKGTVMFAGFLIFVCMVGTVLPFQAEILKKWHVSEADEEIQDKITALAENYEGRAMLAAPAPVMEQAKMRNENIVLPYGKDLWYGNCNREIADVYTEKELILFEQMKIDYEQPDTIAAIAAELKCDILVMREKMSENAQRQYGWEEEEGTEGYAVYCK